MGTPGEDLFSSVLRVAKSTVKPAHQGMGVKIQWDLDNLELRGTFVIPLQTQINAETGEYIVTSQDFTEPPTNTSGET
jgi:hypothetical protein